MEGGFPGLIAPASLKLLAAKRSASSMSAVFRG